MKINFVRKDRSIRFGALKPGDVFTDLSNDNVFMKISGGGAGTGCKNSVLLNSGSLWEFMPDTTVGIPLKCDLIIE